MSSDVESVYTPWSMPAPIPLPVETERLVLTRPSAVDAAAFFELIERFREELSVWLPWPRVDHLTPEQSAASLAAFDAAFEKPDANALMIPVIDRRTGETIGATGVHDIDRTNSACEVGYWVRPDRQGRGLCTEAVRAHVSALFRTQQEGGWGFRRVIVRCDAENAASIAIPRKLKLRHEGTFVEHCRRSAAGGFRDTVQFAALRREWDFGAGCVR